jgi:hypothetical protein
MKKNSLRKTFSFLAALAVAGSVMTSSVNPAHAKTISSHRSVLVGQTITVKVKKGKKQKSSNKRIATVSKKYTKKRKRVTVRRKGKKIRKWKTVKVPNGKFAIKGIRAGQATITIRSGRKTYKFKVTVKNRPASKTSSSSKPSTSSSSSSHSSESVTTNSRPAGMTVPNGPVESEFRIDPMANQNKFYNTPEKFQGGSTVIIHWKTNLKLTDLFLYNETTNKFVGGDSLMVRKRYHRTSDDDYGSYVKTNDGYAFAITEKKPGKYKYSVIVSGPNGDEKIGYNTTATVTFEDYKTAENEALNALISRSGAASKSTVKDKLNTLADYMATKKWENGSFIHPGEAKYPGEYADTYGDYGVWFQSRVITCVGATAIIEKCAAKMGVPSSAMSRDYPTGPGFGAQHVRNKFTINGDTFTVDGSPLTFIKPWTNI